MKKTLRLLLVSSLTLSQLVSLSNIKTVEAQDQPTVKDEILPTSTDTNEGTPFTQTYTIYQHDSNYQIIGSYDYVTTEEDWNNVDIYFTIPLLDNIPGYKPAYPTISAHRQHEVFALYVPINDPEPQPTVVTPVAPSQDGNLVTIPEVEGVVYSTGNFELTAENPTVTVTATAAEGYVLADGSVTEWTFTYVSSEIEEKPVTPIMPIQSGNTISIPVVEGVIYIDLNGNILQGTIDLSGDGTEIGAIANDGYYLSPSIDDLGYSVYVTPVNQFAWTWAFDNYELDYSSIIAEIEELIETAQALLQDENLDKFESENLKNAVDSGLRVVEQLKSGTSIGGTMIERNIINNLAMWINLATTEENKDYEKEYVYFIQLLDSATDYYVSYQSIHTDSPEEVVINAPDIVGYKLSDNEISQKTIKPTENIENIDLGGNPGYVASFYYDSTLEEDEVLYYIIHNEHTFYGKRPNLERLLNYSLDYETKIGKIGETVTGTVKDIPGYKSSILQSKEKSTLLTDNRAELENNTIIFNYIKDTDYIPEILTVTPVEPVGDGNSITIPNIEGITYSVEGHGALSAGDRYFFNDEAITVVALANDGYVLAEGAQNSWIYEPTDIEPEIIKYQFDVYGKTLNSNRVELLSPELLGTFYVEGVFGEVVTIEFPIRSDEWNDPEPLTFTIGDNMPSIIEVERILINTEDEINGVKEAINKAKEVLAKGGWTTESASTLEETISKGERSLKFISEGGYILTDTLGNLVDQLAVNTNNLVKASDSSESSSESESSDESAPEESSDENSESESESTSSDESSSDKDSDESQTDDGNESTSTDKKQANESDKAKLPETGESSSIYAVLTALILGLIGMLVLRFKPKPKH